jgi:hypothetical protein
LSTFTKALIVLVTLASFFLCGTVAIYVATAENFKDKSNKTTTDLQAAKQNENKAKKTLEENNAKNLQRETELNNEMTGLKTQTTDLQTKLTDSEREKAELLNKVNSCLQVTKDLSVTADKQREMFNKTFDELKQVKADQIKDRAKLDETEKTLMEKMAVIDTLEAEKKRLLEEKTDLQAKLDKMLMPGGQTAVASKPVTQERSSVRSAGQVTSSVNTDIALHGLVKAVDLKNSMASISLGTADGVKAGMKFHVTRGDNFLCDILIVNVDTKEAVGVLELVQQQPKVGDTVSTNL